MPYGHFIAATVITLGVCQDHSSIESFSILTSASCGPSAIAELLVNFMPQCGAGPRAKSAREFPQTTSAKSWQYFERQSKGGERSGKPQFSPFSLQDLGNLGKPIWGRRLRVRVSPRISLQREHSFRCIGRISYIRIYLCYFCFR